MHVERRRILLMRHGAVEDFDEHGRPYPPDDVPLTPQGVEQLSIEVRKEINTIIGGPAPKKKTKKSQESAPEPPSDKARPDDPVQAVLFTSFIIQ